MSPRPWWDIGMPHDASVDGWRIDEMIHVTTAFVVLIFAIVVVWLLWSVIRHGPRHAARYDDGASPRSWRWTLVVAGAIFFVVDGHLFISSVSAVSDVYGNFAFAEAQPGAVRIEVNAHQWAWTMRYAGPDGKFNTRDDILGFNEVVVPQGRPIIFQLTSTDVIHSFNVPAMRVKIDTVPGTVNRMWFTPKETGTFEIGCAQHCGLNHYKMKGELRVLPGAEYEAWAAAASANSAQAYDEADTQAHWGWDWSEHARIP